MIYRKIKEFGLNPFLGISLIIVSVIGFSVFLYTKTPEFAQYICMLIALSYVGNLSEFRRNEFLEQNYGTEKYIQLRALENIVSSIPVFLILIIHANYLSAFLLLALSALLSIKKIRLPGSFVLPTPFGKKPFEFIIGFRNTFIIVIAAYLVLAISCVVNNYNLGLFSLLILFVVISGYYTKPENEYYVWLHSKTPKQFLVDKIKVAILQTAIISLPLLLVLSFTHFEEIGVLVAAYLLGYVFVITMIFIKYSSFPNQISIASGIVIAMILSFPPLLLVCAPYFYFKSIEKLERYLV